MNTSFSSKPRSEFSINNFQLYASIWTWLAMLFQFAMAWFAKTESVWIQVKIPFIKYPVILQNSDLWMYYGLADYILTLDDIQMVIRFGQERTNYHRVGQALDVHPYDSQKKSSWIILPEDDHHKLAGEFTYLPCFSVTLARITCVWM